MNAAAQMPAADTLRQHLSYDPETGKFTKIAAPGRPTKWKPGRECGSTNKATGYIEVFVLGAKHYGHRLAWVMAHGSIPPGMRIDHANRDRADNRLANLRLATQADNLRNCKVRRDNTSGVKGVYFDSARGKWVAAVGRKMIGRYATRADAAQARARAAAAAFGQFANDTALA